MNHRSPTYIFSSVALEGARVNLHIGTVVHKNCSPLLSWMSRPGIGAQRKFRNVLQTITHPLTYKAVLVSKVESWTTRVPSIM
jgi:hypothetical protein